MGTETHIGILRPNLSVSRETLVTQWRQACSGKALPKTVQGFKGSPADGRELEPGKESQRPLLPKPPSPRAVSVSAGHSANAGSSTRCTTNWAMRSPTLTRKLSLPEL